MVVALDDCTKSVMTAPQNVPCSGVALPMPSRRAWLDVVVKSTCAV